VVGKAVYDTILKSPNIIHGLGTQEKRNDRGVKENDNIYRVLEDAGAGKLIEIDGRLYVTTGTRNEARDEDGPNSVTYTLIDAEKGVPYFVRTESEESIGITKPTTGTPVDTSKVTYGPTTLT
jgi:hypothetical protein